MTPELARTLARYNRWMNEKVYAVAGRMDDAERKRDRGAFFRSIHATLDHILLADRVWMGRFTGAPVEAGALGPGGIRTLDQELHADFSALRSARVAMDDTLDRWVEGLTEEALAGPLRFTRAGAMNEMPLWWAVSHLFNHQTHHRGQVTTLLSQAGHDPGVTDLVAMLREEREKRA